MKILMVCLGNICRSPLAEGILKKITENDTEISWEIDSAGVGDWHSGEAPDARAIRMANKHGIQIGKQKARTFNHRDFNHFDFILVMDEEIRSSILAKSSDPAHRAKVKLLLDFKYPAQNKIVPDPYFDGRFEESYDLIYKGCEAFLEYIKENKAYSERLKVN